MYECRGAPPSSKFPRIQNDRLFNRILEANRGYIVRRRTPSGQWRRFNRTAATGRRIRTAAEQIDWVGIYGMPCDSRQRLLEPLGRIQLLYCPARQRCKTGALLDGRFSCGLIRRDTNEQISGGGISGIDLTSATTVVPAGWIFKMMRAESIGAFAVSQNESPIDCACRFGVAVSGIPMLIPVALADNHSSLEAGRQSDQNRIPVPFDSFSCKCRCCSCAHQHANHGQQQIRHDFGRRSAGRTILSK